MPNPTSFFYWRKLLYQFLFVGILSLPPLLVPAQKETDKILELYSLINLSYVDSFSSEKVIEGAIQGMLEELDPHSVYIPRKEVEEINEALNGSFEGIGVQFHLYHDTILVVSPISGGPSEKLGVKSGDRIIKANDTLISGVGLNDDQVIRTLRGKKGSQVKVTIKRPGVSNLVDFLITRDEIPIFSIDISYMSAPSTGYIKINRFSRTTMDEFQKAFKELEGQGMENLIIDLRGNGGGFLHSSVELADELIDSKEVLVKTQGLRQKDQAYRASPNGLFTTGKLIILIDEGSASASEILAGAVQDLDRGIIIGRRSFGKGLVMKPYMLSDGSMIRLTTSRYYTPSGRCIQKDYLNSRDEYQKEIMDRFENGELFTVDSTVFADSLQFHTMNGRLVFGGGGIFPDIFVPADTLLSDESYQQVIRSGAYPEFALDYVDANRKSLLKENRDESALIENNDLSIELINDFSEYLIEKEIIDSVPDSVFHEKMILQLKAFIARNLWNDRSYYKVINHGQPLLIKAHEIINTDQFNWEDLSFK